MFSFLYNRNPNKLDVATSKNRKDDYDTAMAQYGKWSNVDYDNNSLDYDVELTNLLNKGVGDKLIPFLKQHLLNALFFSCCSEIQHIIDAFYPIKNIDYTLDDKYYYTKKIDSDLFDALIDSLPSDEANIIGPFITQHIHFLNLFIAHQSITNAGMICNKYDIIDKLNSHSNFQDAVEKFDFNNVNGFEDYTSKDFIKDCPGTWMPQHILSRLKSFCYFDSFKNPIKIIKLFEKLFLRNGWKQAFGGKPWANICLAYINLYNSKDINQQLIQIDHVYDLQHNTGFALNKSPMYFGTDKIFKEILDHKAIMKSPYEIIDEISSSFQLLAYRLIKSKFGTSWSKWEDDLFN
jgi:hypothetical protein